FPAQPDFFLSLDWYRCLFDTVLRPTMQPVVLVSDTGRANGDDPALLICGSERNGQLRSMTNYYAMNFGLLSGASAAHRKQHAEDIVAQIARGRWSTVQLDLLRMDLPDLELLEQAFVARSFAVERHLSYENWYLPTDGTTFDAYYGARPSQLRNTITRREKKVRKEQAF